jgi:hypothetical protein
MSKAKNKSGAALSTLEAMKQEATAKKRTVGEDAISEVVENEKPDKKDDNLENDIKTETVINLDSLSETKKLKLEIKKLTKQLERKDEIIKSLKNEEAVTLPDHPAALKKEHFNVRIPAILKEAYEELCRSNGKDSTKFTETLFKQLVSQSTVDYIYKSWPKYR